MEKKILVNEEVVNDIQLKDAKVQGLQAVLENMITAHLMDEKNILSTSPVFLGFQNNIATAKAEFETAKDTMICDVLSADERAKVKTWNLNYYTNEFTYEV